MQNARFVNKNAFFVNKICIYKSNFVILHRQTKNNNNLNNKIMRTEKTLKREIKTFCDICGFVSTVQLHTITTFDEQGLYVNTRHEVSYQITQNEEPIVWSYKDMGEALDMFTEKAISAAQNC